MNRLKRGGALVAALLTLVGCTTVGVFDALVPKDRARTVATDEAYGALSRQTLDIYAPPATVERPANGWPVLVFVHGGSWATGDKNSYSWAGKALASRGYLAVVPNYRLVPGGRYPNMVRDTAAAITWTHANAARFEGDASRLAVSGHSAGGYNAVHAAYAPGFVPRGIVKAVVALSAPVDFLPLDTNSTISAFGDASDLAATQPINFTRRAPPTLIIHGLADTTVEPRHARELARRLEASGIDHELRLYADTSHEAVVLGLSRPLRGRAPTLADMDAFLKRVLR